MLNGGSTFNEVSDTLVIICYLSKIVFFINTRNEYLLIGDELHVLMNRPVHDNLSCYLFHQASLCNINSIYAFV